jgi:hypothetical protein
MINLLMSQTTSHLFLFKVRVIDGAGTHTSELIKNGKYSPHFRISKFDETLAKRWGTQLSVLINITQKMTSGYWEKKR